MSATGEGVSLRFTWTAEKHSGSTPVTETCVSDDGTTYAPN